MLNINKYRHRNNQMNDQWITITILQFLWHQNSCMILRRFTKSAQTIKNYKYKLSNLQVENIKYEKGQ